VLIVGYCEPRTLGGRIKSGEKKVSIFGTVFEVKADIRELESYSAHGDYAEMTVFLSCQDKAQLKRIFLVHGDYETQQKYKAHLEFNRFAHVEIPGKGDVVKL
jgi:metallo-beta-lactamase family protein